MFIAIVIGVKLFHNYVFIKLFFYINNRSCTTPMVVCSRMEGLICCWALVMLLISYTTKGLTTPKLISCHVIHVIQFQIYMHAVTVTYSQCITTVIQRAQQNDLVTMQIHDALSNSHNIKPTNSTKQPQFRKYLQIWHQPSVIDGVACQT